jgi:hypothetical protein
MTARDDVLATVPVGEENKKDARAIHAELGCWAFVVIRRHLRELAEEGAIMAAPKRNTQPNLYYRQQ